MSKDERWHKSRNLSEDRRDADHFSYGLGSHDGMIHTDHLGTPHKMTDVNQTVVWSAYYKPFGAATVTVSTITNNLRFPGQYYDVETGLNYNYFRDYNPVIGRYIETDPWYSGMVLTRSLLPQVKIRLLGTGKQNDLSPYPYVRNSPVNQKDPYGLFSVGDLLPDPADIYKWFNPHPGPLPPDDPNTPDPEYRLGFKSICVKVSCNTNTCDTYNGPWLVTPKSNSCWCVEWQTVSYVY